MLDVPEDAAYDSTEEGIDDEMNSSHDADPPAAACLFPIQAGKRLAADLSDRVRWTIHFVNLIQCLHGTDQIFRSPDRYAVFPAAMR